ncbi:threonine ammonia-lyase [Peristeroidobacter agariperforans]|uniref:threonine ammonia-lyase n=1 Tax=Peristeroidobacter agariperforans TaxID=268404 RepID=UPI00101BC8D5|nr:pyridoxal-phosphate dependent enzyme [Peristeroidobacter agariperforans]
MSTTQRLHEIVLQARHADFISASERLAPYVMPSPLIAFPGRPGRTLRLKAENLQPLGSFKIRAAFNVLLQAASRRSLSRIATASAGNFAQGLMLAARQLGAQLSVHIPDTAAENKRAALRNMGANLFVHSFTDWWRILMTRETGAAEELFIHPVCEPDVIIGNGSIGVELLEQWPEVDTVVVPIGGGGLAAGIALALRSAGRRIRIVGCEIETAAPLSAARAAGRPVPVNRAPSFVDGIGSNCVLDEMWPLLRDLIDDVVVVSVEQARAAVRTLAQTNHLVVEGAAAVAFAAASSPDFEARNVAAILSGGNIDHRVLCEILSS